VSHKESLQQLFPPVEIGGALETAQTVHGGGLDVAEGKIDALLEEIFPDTATLLLDRWEALYEIVPPEGAAVAERQAAVAERHCRKGDIKKPYFVALAAAMGYTIRIDDYIESQAGWLCAGDELLDEPGQDFTAGVSGAGDYLGYTEDPILPFFWKVVVIGAGVGPAADLEALLGDLKPGHMQLNFEYM
jgi:uncharacterized protein YmfQ (DUF2313 family)